MTRTIKGTLTNKIQQAETPGLIASEKNCAGY